MRTVSPGQPFSMSADEFNSFQQAAQFVRAERTRRGASSGFGNVIDRTQPLVVSESSESIRAFSAVKITGIQEKPDGGPTDDFISLTPLKVDKPTGSDGNFLIVQDGLPEQGMAARALTHGITPAWVTFTSGAETSAGPAENSFDLKAGGSGAEILWKPEGTGSLLCVVQVGAGGGGGSAFRVAKLTAASSATAPTELEVNGYASTLEGVAVHLDTCVAGLSSLSDPGLATISTALDGIAADTDDMMDDPGHVAEQLAGKVDDLTAIQESSQAAIDAHNENIDNGGSGTLTSAELADHNAIISACTSASSAVAGVAGSLANHASGSGNAAIYAVNNYGVLVATGESVPVRCELLKDNESISGFCYIARSADDSLYRIVARFPSGHAEQSITYVNSVSCVDGDIVGNTTTKTVLVPASEE